MALKTLISLAELNQTRAEMQGTVGFVPTMGALHQGHIALVKAAKTECQHVIVSIFVNPTQFGKNEDFSKYPRTLQDDLKLLEAAQADALFLPNTKDIYPDHYQTYLTNDDLGNQLCGAYRPGHFRGVLTIVNKLFNMVRPHTAYFGKKDYQQWCILQKMVHVAICIHRLYQTIFFCAIAK